MWKIFVIVAAVALIGSGVLSYQNKIAYEREIELREKEEGKLAKSVADLTRTKETLKQTGDTLVKVEQDTVELKADLATVEVKVSEQGKQENALSDELDGIIGEIDASKTLVENLGPIDEMEKAMKDLEADVVSARQEVLSLKNALSIAEDRKKRIGGEIQGYVTRGRDQLNGVIRTALRASVAGVYEGYGFVVIDAGDKQGMVAKAQLSVQRGGAEICRLKVTEVESGRSVASILPETLAEGQVVQPGDTVIPVIPVVPEAAPAGSAAPSA
ncbi:MAG: hypothetical protein ACC661_04100 [Verrucomicrobiales bacterium]